MSRGIICQQQSDKDGSESNSHVKWFGIKVGFSINEVVTAIQNWTNGIAGFATQAESRFFAQQIHKIET
jgi:hypothetical protein